MHAPTSNQAYDRLEPWGYGEGLETPVHVYGINIAVPLLAIALLMIRWWRCRRDAARARAVEQGATASSGRPVPLTPGPRVVRGKVREVESGDVAARVAVFQHGAEKESKNSWTTTWRESERRIQSCPFELELADGARLRVEPGKSPRLVDTLGAWTRVEDTVRMAEAKLEVGEEVFVSGELSVVRDPVEGYRGGERIVLSAPASGPMLLSTVGLSKPHRSKARRAANWVMVLTLAALLAQILVVQYHVAVWFGETRPATVEQLTAVKNEDRNGRVRWDRFVTYRVQGADESDEDEVDDEDYAKLEEGAVVPVHVSPLQTTIGPHPTLHGLLGLLPSVALIVLAVVAVWRGYRRTAWYEIKLSEAISGRLGTMPRA